MRQPSVSSRILIILGIVVLGLSLESPGLAQRVLVSPRSSSELRLSKITSHWSTESPGSPGHPCVTITLTVENVSDRAIRVYAVNLDGPSVKASKGLGLNVLQAYELFAPGQLRTESFSPVCYDGMPKTLRIRAYIGEYFYGLLTREPRRVAQLTAGMAAGKNAALLRLREEVHNKGIEEVLKMLRETGWFLEPPSGQNADWKIGFDKGVRDVAVLILHAHENGGNEAVQRFLKQP